MERGAEGVTSEVSCRQAAKCREGGLGLRVCVPRISGGTAGGTSGLRRVLSFARRHLARLVALQTGQRTSPLAEHLLPAQLWAGGIITLSHSLAGSMFLPPLTRESRKAKLGGWGETAENPAQDPQGPG